MDNKENAEKIRKKYYAYSKWIKSEFLKNLLSSSNGLKTFSILKLFTFIIFAFNLHVLNILSYFRLILFQIRIFAFVVC